MPCKRSQQLQQILLLSQEMLAKAGDHEWGLVADIEARRSELVARCFQQPAQQQHAAEVAAAIREMALSGRWSKLDRLRGSADPAAILRSIPGIGPRLAELLYDELHIDSLEQLECAAHDGRLAAVRGIVDLQGHG